MLCSSGDVLCGVGAVDNVGSVGGVVGVFCGVGGVGGVGDVGVAGVGGVLVCFGPVSQSNKTSESSSESSPSPRHENQAQTSKTFREVKLLLDFHNIAHHRHCHGRAEIENVYTRTTKAI